MKKEELKEKYDRIKNSDSLMRVRGLKEQTDAELNKALRERNTNNYSLKIKKLMVSNNKEEARKMLVKKKQKIIILKD